MSRKYSYKIISKLDVLPVSLDLFKKHLKLPPDYTDDDEYLTLLIESAASFFEEYTGRTLINTTYKTFRDYFITNFRLRESKLQSVEFVKYYYDNVLTELDATNYYFTDSDNYSDIVFTYLPEKTDTRLQAIEIQFVAGYGINDSYVPKDIQLAIMQYANLMFENRGDCDDTVIQSKDFLPNNARLLYDNYRIYDIAPYNYE